MINLPEFFTTEVKKALQRQSLDVSQEVEYYLVQLLTRFALSDNFYKSAAGGGLEDRPLALRLYDSVFDPENKFMHLKNLGDTALFGGGGNWVGKEDAGGLGMDVPVLKEGLGQERVA